MARRRSLRPEEEEIWQQVARSARPLHPGRAKREEAGPLPVLPPVKPGPPPPVSLPLFRVGDRALQPGPRHDLAPTIAGQLANAPLRMDAGTHKAMRRGKLGPEARLDLHGMTLSEAHPELIRFVLNAHADGMRLVLVITGKGKERDRGGPIPTRTGALRHQVPQWLRLAPLAGVVLQATPAHLKHGGEGALYLYLRRVR